jgi:type IV pilus assembly protein PilV
MLNRGQIMKQKSFSTISAQQGAVLLEAMIAILLFSIGVLAVVGLQASMINNTSDAKYRSDAAYVAQQMIGKMWTDQTNLSTYLVTNGTVATSVLPGGKLNIAASASQITVTVGWTAPGETAAPGTTSAPCYLPVAHCYTTTASIAGG